MGKPGRGKSVICVIGPSGGSVAAKMAWKPIMQLAGGRTDTIDLSASRRTLCTRGRRAARSRWRARRRPCTIDPGCIAFVMIPESGDSLPCNSIVLIPAAVVCEYGKLLLVHHICRRLGLNPTPDIPNVSFEQLSNGRRNCSILVFFGYVESTRDGQLIRSLTTHFMMSKSSRWGCQDEDVLTQLAQERKETKM